jgi:hypothetical protein
MKKTYYSNQITNPYCSNGKFMYKHNSDKTLGKKEWEMTKDEWVEEQGKKVSGMSVGKTKKLARLLHSDFVRIWKAEGKIK